MTKDFLGLSKTSRNFDYYTSSQVKLLCFGCQRKQKIDIIIKISFQLTETSKANKTLLCW